MFRHKIYYTVFQQNCKKKFFSGHAFFSVLAMSKIYVMIGEYEYIIYITY